MVYKTKNLTKNELFFTQINRMNNQQKSNIAHYRISNLLNVGW